MDRLTRVCARIVDARAFNILIVAMILITALGLGLETSRSLGAEWGGTILIAYDIALAVFVVEAAIKLTAVAPRFGRYFGNGWDLFDFVVLVLAFLPDTGDFALIARLARLLRVLRVATVLPQLRLIVATLIRSLPGLGNVMLLLSVLYYVYAVAGVHLFQDHDPTHWRSLGIGLLTLFRVMTLEDWTDVMYIAMELHPMAWLFFVSFVMLAAVIMINLVIAVVINNLQDARLEVSLAGGEDTLKTIRDEAASARDALQRIEKIVADLRK
ncbi:MAG: ion transporter [Defluviicoccus sp.]|nr:ion transporter [Defluviicoccus sp.]